MEKKYPIGGYAPGNYHCTCGTCHTHFKGDKQAVQCEPCAMAAKERFDALDPNEQELLIKRNARIANFMFSGPLTAERELIYRIVEGWGNEIEMPNMEGWLKEYAAEATPQGIGWVKASERLPEKFVEVIVRNLNTGRAKKTRNIGHDTGWDIALDKEFMWDNTEWLDESLPHLVDAEAFAKFLDDQRNNSTPDMWAEKLIWNKPTAFQDWLKYFKQQK